MPPRDPRRRSRVALGSLFIGLGAALLMLRRGPQLSSPGFGQALEGSPSGASASGRGSDGSDDAEHHVFRYEPHDADARTLARIMAVAALVVAVAIAGLFALLARFHSADSLGPPLTAQQQAVIVPPGPPLQAEPFRDIAALRERETKLLSTYGWLDPEHRRARIPITRAEALVIGRPLDPAP